MAVKVGNTEAFYFKNATATFSSFTSHDQCQFLLTCYSCSFHSFSVLSALLFCKISYNYPHPFKCLVLSDAGISLDLP